MSSCAAQWKGAKGLKVADQKFHAHRWWIGRHPDKVRPIKKATIGRHPDKIRTGAILVRFATPDVIWKTLMRCLARIHPPACAESCQYFITTPTRIVAFLAEGLSEPNPTHPYPMQAPVIISICTPACLARCTSPSYPAVCGGPVEQARLAVSLSAVIMWCLLRNDRTFFSVWGRESVVPSWLIYPFCSLLSHPREKMSV